MSRLTPNLSLKPLKAQSTFFFSSPLLKPPENRGMAGVKRTRAAPRTINADHHAPFRRTLSTKRAIWLRQ